MDLSLWSIKTNNWSADNFKKTIHLNKVAHLNPRYSQVTLVSGYLNDSCQLTITWVPIRMSTIKLNTDCICLGHLASNARSLQKKSQSERAYYSSHIISVRFSPSVRSRCLHISQGLFCVLWTYTTNRPISGHLDSTSLVNKGFVIFKELEKPSSFSLYFSACGVLTLTINGGSHGKLTG